MPKSGTASDSQQSDLKTPATVPRAPINHGGIKILKSLGPSVSQAEDDWNLESTQQDNVSFRDE